MGLLIKLKPLFAYLTDLVTLISKLEDQGRRSSIS